MFDINIAVDDKFTITARPKAQKRQEANQVVRQALRDACRGVQLRFPSFPHMEAALTVSQELIQQGIGVMAIRPVSIGSDADQFVSVTVNDRLQTWANDGLSDVAEQIYVKPDDADIKNLRNALREAGWTSPNMD